MSLPLDVEKAIADEKAKRDYGTEQDLAILIEKERTKAAPPPEDKKEEKKPEEKKEAKADADLATELLEKRLGFTRKKKESDEKKEEDKKADDDAVGGEDSSDKKSAADKSASDGPVEEGKGDKKKGKISKKPDLDPIEIASATAARTAQAFMAGNEARAKEAPEKSDDKGIADALSDDEKGELEVFKEMAKADAKFRELPRQYLTYLKRAEEYQRQWEKDHPTEEFNPEAGDHDAFYAKHQPKYSELKYKEAIARMVSRQEQSQEIEKLTKEQKRLQSELAARELDPVINQTSVGALARVIEAINPEILKAIEKEGFQKYADGNEVEADLIKEVANRIGLFIAGLLQFDDPDGRIPFNDKNPAHIEAVRYLREKEQELAKKPWRERMNDGKIIVPRGEFFRMTEAQKAQHTYLDTATLLQLRIEEEAQKAQIQYEKELKKAEARAKQLGWLPPSRKENGQKAKEEKPEKEDKSEEKHVESKSPEAGSAARTDTTGEVQSKAKKDVVDLTADILFQRR